MFCPKCGSQNPENGKFCRSCGTDLGNLTGAIAPRQTAPLVSRRGRPISIESAITKIFTGLAFCIIAFILGYTRMAGAGFWWFWMLIPGFGSLGKGIAQLVQIRTAQKDNERYRSIESGGGQALPPAQTQFIPVESRYKTGDLVPPSVTDNTTRHLEFDDGPGTIPLPKK